MQTYLIYRIADGLILNSIVYDGISLFPLDEDTALELLPDGVSVGIGWTRIKSGEYLEPVEIENATE